MTKLSEHFTLEEMTLSQTAVRHGLRNAPGAAEIENLRRLCVNVLEPLRKAAKAPIIVSSGYRSATVNRLVGGRRGSQHTKGQAADIVIPGLTVHDTIKLIARHEIECDQVIDEFARWVHVSYAHVNRNEYLSARRVNGAVVYSPLLYV